MTYTFKVYLDCWTIDSDFLYLLMQFIKNYCCLKIDYTYLGQFQCQTSILFFLLQYLSVTSLYTFIRTTYFTSRFLEIVCPKAGFVLGCRTFAYSLFIGSESKHLQNRCKMTSKYVVGTSIDDCLSHSSHFSPKRLLAKGVEFNRI